MIYDRTQQDVDNATKLLAKIKDGQTVTESEKTQIERGILSIAALNRIEGKESDLRDALALLGYNAEIPCKTWTYADLIRSGDYVRILRNVDRLKELVSLRTVSTPSSMFTFANLNVVEKLLHDVQVYVENISKSVVYSNEVFTGEV